MRRHLAVAGAILAVGWSAAVVVYVRASAAPPPEDPEAEAEAYDVTHSRSYAREVERIGGKGTALAIELNEALAAALRGRNLAYAIAVASAAAAGGWLLLARLATAAGEDPPRAERRGDDDEQ